MNVILWLLAGGFAGWVAIRFMRANAYRGVLASIAIGIFGGYFGGSVLTPMLGDTSAMPDAINPVALIMALASAAVCLTVSDMVYRRFHV
jgi:uncharacterized membrane protein YeaQ/YmgE (transglycosylase-associated protein family)